MSRDAVHHVLTPAYNAGGCSAGFLGLPVKAGTASIMDSKLPKQSVGLKQRRYRTPQDMVGSIGLEPTTSTMST